MKKWNNLQEALHEAAEKTANPYLYTLSSQLKVEHELSRHELINRAKIIAAYLATKNVKKGDRVILIYSSGAEFILAFFGCIYAGVIAVPCHAPTNNHLMAKLLSVVRNAQPKLILSESLITTKLSQLKLINQARKIKIFNRIIDMFHSDQLTYPAELAALDWISTDKLNNTNDNYQPVNVEENDIVFLQYTSGSTGDPKGVMITHQNLMENINAILQQLQIKEDDKVVSWLPHSHDMGLIGGMLLPLFRGIPLYLISPMDFLRHPYNWLSAISQYQGTLSSAPNFAYALCHRKISESQIKTLNLSSWRAALNGAEPIHHQTMKSFIDKFSSCGFNQQAVYPCYGMAESTLFICGRYGLNEAHISKSSIQSHQLNADIQEDNEKHVLISCGEAPKDLVITHPETDQIITNSIGEICITGKSVAKGYWNNETANKNFITLVRDGKVLPYFKTGDLGFVHNGELYVTGRKKDLIVIHGSNHYPQDIEETIYNISPYIRRGSSAAFSINVDGEERLALLVGVDDFIEPEQAEKFISQIKYAVGQSHHLSVYSVTLAPYKQILKTTSGKIQRQKNKLALLHNELKILAQDVKPKTDSEITSDLSIEQTASTYQPQELKQVMRQELAAVLNVAPNTIDDNKLFTDYGLDSLLVIELENKIEDHLQGKYQFSPNDAYDYPTIAKLSKHIDSIIRERF